MRRVKVVLVAAIAIPLAGCALGGKPQTVAAAAPRPPKPADPAPPPERLSIPQTQVDLPAPQPLNPQALVTAQPATDTTSASQTRVQASSTTRSGGGNNPRVISTPRGPETPPAAESEQPARTPIQEVLPADVQKQLRESVHKYQKETHNLLAGVKPHNANQTRAEMEIVQFVKQSEQAEATDLRLADQLAQRAYVLAKELQSGK